jgi:hypothetical protein
MDKSPSIEQKAYKTPIYCRRSVDRYQEKNKDKIKDYHKQYYLRKKQEKENENPKQPTIDDLINNYKQSKNNTLDK